MRRLNLAALLGAVAVGLVAAGCGGGDADAGDAGSVAATAGSVAATAQVTTGFAYTPAAGLRVAAVENADGRLVPARDAVGALVYAVDYGGLDNLHRGRLPYYARVDLRVTNRPGGAGGRWSWYLEAINLLNRDNPVELETALLHDPEGMRPRLIEMPTAGFPLLPSFGVRVRF